MKKALIALGLVGLLSAGVGGTVLASTNVANVGESNKTTRVESLMDEGKTFEEAKSEMLKEKYDRVDAAVKRGAITLEEGKKIKEDMLTNLDKCTTPGENRNSHERYGLNRGMKGSGKGNVENCVNGGKNK
ncbi:hypothetical protein [Clostridium rectalis]|uniref:hypothetical protein n=1 Tax=Clostridium rectalis TaxID=2040295 RepID=UPI000F63231E|nr:hypothetical protein [Clostridium rectalis]